MTSARVDVSNVLYWISAPVLECRITSRRKCYRHKTLTAFDLSAIGDLVSNILVFSVPTPRLGACTTGMGE